MDKTATLTKLLIDSVITQYRLPLSEEMLIALYEDIELAQAINAIAMQIKIKAEDSQEKNNTQKNEDPLLLLLLPPAQETMPKIETEVIANIEAVEINKITTEETTTLKPGQIPQNASSLLTKKPLVRKPIAQITISNAKVGTEFNSTVGITLDTHKNAEIGSILIPDDLGIHFDPKTQSLTGMPTKSGNFTLTVNWISEQEHYSNEILLIINPDPRSLWKINEPPADSPYPKKHIDSKVIIEDGISIAAASRRGRSHEHAGTFRDDDFYIHHDKQSKWNILIVADGAGSARYSREGSRIVTNIVSEYLQEQLKVDKNPALAPYLKIIHQWDNKDEKKQVGNFFSRLFHNASQLAVNHLKNEAIRVNEPVKSFSTTLLATVSLQIDDAIFAASFWMGDGAIAAFSPTGNVRLLGVPDSGEYAGQTRFLDDSAINDNAFNLRIMIGKWTDVSHLILMTDGVSDPYFETDNGLKNTDKWTALVNEISPCLAIPENADKALVEWLNFFSAGNHDDRTIIVAW
ncbi:PP2C family serine/threonine-protein phosphatase [Proteus hauseri]|uniref:PP2C family serine/threonine-protein phosphatase n=1 Tax=Proteus hauseri TaxID=183417 RepID=UPI0010096B45|nr:PP2C family serine/threonine-protein phosphatase [Proteus hauseri]QAV22585.1 protein phosphatase 2C domain-containing protein [Proteus hauseri]